MCSYPAVSFSIINDLPACEHQPLPLTRSRCGQPYPAVKHSKALRNYHSAHPAAISPSLTHLPGHEGHRAREALLPHASPHPHPSHLSSHPHLHLHSRHTHGACPFSAINLNLSVHSQVHFLPHPHLYRIFCPNSASCLSSVFASARV